MSHCRWPLTLVLAAAFLALAAGCSSRAEGALLEERFGDQTSGWGSDSQPSFDRGYEGGHYFIEIYEPDWLAWARPGERFTDVIVEVEAQWISGFSDGHFGVVCRFRPPADFYYFAITDDGYYGILRVEDGEPTSLTGSGFPSSTAIVTDGAVNTLRAVCWGSDLSMTINGELVATVVDERFRRGDVGLAAGSGPSGSIRVHFDNLAVTAPEDETEEVRE